MSGEKVVAETDTDGVESEGMAKAANLFLLLSFLLAEKWSDTLSSTSKEAIQAKEKVEEVGLKEG